MSRPDGRSLHAFRRQLKLNQTQMGILMGYSKKSAKSRISELENSRVPLSRRNLTLINLIRHGFNNADDVRVYMEASRNGKIKSEG